MQEIPWFEQTCGLSATPCLGCLWSKDLKKNGTPTFLRIFTTPPPLVLEGTLLTSRKRLLNFKILDNISLLDICELSSGIGRFLLSKTADVSYRSWLPGNPDAGNRGFHLDESYQSIGKLLLGTVSAKTTREATPLKPILFSPLRPGKYLLATSIQNLWKPSRSSGSGKIRLLLLKHLSSSSKTLYGGIDPAEWASLCRYIGTLSLMEFECVRKKFLPQHSSVNSKQQGICHHSDNLVKIPLVSIGPSGIGGEYQRET